MLSEAGAIVEERLISESFAGDYVGSGADYWVKDFDLDESRAIISYFSYGHLYLSMLAIRKTKGSKSWVYKIPGQSVVDFVFDPFLESNKIDPRVTFSNGLFITGLGQKEIKYKEIIFITLFN